MTPKRVAYFGHHGSTLLFVKVHREFVRMGVAEPTPSFLTFNNYWKKQIHRLFPDAPVSLLPNILDWMLYRGNGITADADAVRAWKLDKVLRNKPLNKFLFLWSETRRRIGFFLDENKPAVMFSEVVQSMPCYAAFLECKKRNIPYVQMASSRLSGRMEFFTSDHSCPDGLDMSMPPSAEALSLAKTYIDNVLQRTEKTPDYMKDYVKKSVPIKRSDFSKGWVYLQEQFMGGILEPTSPSFMHPFISKFSARRAAKKHFSKDIFKSLDDVKSISGPKILFPMHVTPEASTDWWTPAYADMLDVIQNVAKNLPDGWTLVAKEHPSSVFLQRRAGELEAIANTARVLLVGPHESNELLLAECRHLLVISSTLGIEAAIKGYPVITLGQPFYDASHNTIPCASYEKLPEALRAAEHFQPRADDMLTFIAKYYDATEAGYPVNFFLFPDADTAANVERVAKSLSKRFLL